MRPTSVRERSEQLFHEAAAGALADKIESTATPSPQLSLFTEEAPTVRGQPSARPVDAERPTAGRARGAARWRMTAGR